MVNKAFSSPNSACKGLEGRREVPCRGTAAVRSRGRGQTYGTEVRCRLRTTQGRTSGAVYDAAHGVEHSYRGATGVLSDLVQHGNADSPQDHGTAYRDPSNGRFSARD